MDCYYSKMHTFRHFLFLNYRRKSRDSNFCNTLKFMRSSKFSHRDIYSVAYSLQITNCNTNNSRGTDFRRAWLHSSGRRFRADMNNDSINGTSGSSSYGGGDANGDGQGLYSSMKKKPGKCKTYWVCSRCGESHGQWWGICLTCKAVNSLQELHVQESRLGVSSGAGAGFRTAEARVGRFNPDTDVRHQNTTSQPWSVNSGKVDDLKPQRLSDVTRGLSKQQWRIPMTGPFGIEVGRVLGGGLVPGSLVLVGGDPGVGKSTLLLQMCALLSQGCEVCEPAPVLYVSGEESVYQIGNRASRMHIDAEGLLLYSSTDLDDILDKICNCSPKPRAVVVDSIQTVNLRAVSGGFGSITQVKECATGFLHIAKKTDIPIFLVGHVTKSGDIAGPRVLEHVVDVVLYLEGDRLLSHRILRTVKNRFGSTDEIGVLEMGHDGLQPVRNPSELYISDWDSDQDVLAGVALTVIIDGSRPFLIQIQALCCTRAAFGISAVGRFNGVEDKRAVIIIAVLEKQAGVKFHESSIFLNVVGGVRLRETATDLAIAASICSSFFEIPIPFGMAFLGEIGLGGELRTVARIDKRINELAKLGFTKCVIPKSSMKSIMGLQWEGFSIIECKNVKEVINKVFKNRYDPKVENEGQQESESGNCGEWEQKSVSEREGICEQAVGGMGSNGGEHQDMGRHEEVVGMDGHRGGVEQNDVNVIVGVGGYEDIREYVVGGAKEQKVRGRDFLRRLNEERGGGHYGELKGGDFHRRANEESRGGYYATEQKRGDFHQHTNEGRGRLSDVGEQSGGGCDKVRGVGGDGKTHNSHPHRHNSHYPHRRSGF